MSQDPSNAGKPPVRLGKYEVLSRIGKGGMGTVYRAVDTDLNRLVALKVLSPEMAAKPAMLERFRQEARSAARLKHENIITVHDVGEQNGTYYIALEFVDGKDLHDFIGRKGKLEPAQAREILTQAARALEHAHSLGMVHRDVKPSNFLVSEEGGRLHVKLADMGLARMTGDEDAKITKDHTTVGTIDYMAPEQANNSRAADIRSDLYSLGCTLYHMLAGHSPFPKGSIPERIVAHFKVEPPDIQKLNDKVPDDLAAILKKMLAKKPSHRYQTPAELIFDLESPDIALKPLNADNPKPVSSPAKPVRPVKKPSSSTVPNIAPASAEEKTKKAKGKKKSRDRDRDDAKTSAGLMWALGASGVLVAAAIVWFATRSGDTIPSDPGLKPSAPPSPPLVQKKFPDPSKGKKSETQFVGPLPQVHPALFRPTAPLDPVTLAKQYRGESKFPAEAPDAAVVVWKRAAGDDEAQTLAEAISRAGDKEKIVVHIHDNGPLWLPSAAILKKRHLQLRAAPGFRPLIAWDTAGTSEKTAPPAMLHLAQGSLVLEGIDLVAKPDHETKGACHLIRLENASFFARDCTFSVAGKNASALAFVHSSSSAPTQVVFNRCYLRGLDVQPLVIQGDTDVLIEGSLIVGGNEPLVHLINSGSDDTTLRLIRSTLVGTRNALTWKLDNANPGVPAFKTFAWDCILSRTDGGASAGDMVRMTGDAKALQMHWKAKAVNCLYAGWKKLLEAPDKSIGSGAIDTWRSHWFAVEGDRELLEFWPLRPIADPGNAPSSVYRTLDSAACFAATSGPGMVGCDIGAIPAGPPQWLARTYERYPVPKFTAVTEFGFPSIPAGGDGLFHGEKVDLTKIDLGLYLEAMVKNTKPGPKVVLHLFGRGRIAMSPVRITGVSHLFLFFDPPLRGKDETPTLVPKGGGGVGSALIEMDGGVLEMVNGRIQFPDTRSAILPASLIKVRNGEVRFRGCTFEGPHDRAPDSFQSLLRVEATDAISENPLPVMIQDCVLHANRCLVDLDGSNFALWVKNSVLLAGDDAVHLMSSGTPRPSTFLLFEDNTFAVRKSFLKIDVPPEASYPIEPILVQATRNYFLDPYTATPRQAALLTMPGEEIALGRVLWQGQDNGMEESRWQAFWAGGAKSSAAAWRSWWGPLGERGWKTVVPAPSAKTFPVDAPAFDRLLLPPPHRIGAASNFGADLIRLGLVRKK